MAQFPCYSSPKQKQVKHSFSAGLEMEQNITQGNEGPGGNFKESQIKLKWNAMSKIGYLPTPRCVTLRRQKLPSEMITFIY
jgi:hypothetical protein